MTYQSHLMSANRIPFTFKKHCSRSLTHTNHNRIVFGPMHADAHSTEHIIMRFFRKTVTSGIHVFNHFFSLKDQNQISKHAECFCLHNFFLSNFHGK